MPTKCSIRGCDSFYAKGKPFFNLPTELKYKYAWEKAQLAKRRKKLWLEAMGIQEDEASKMIRICAKHFLSGQPAALENTTDIDWVPSFNMNLSGSSAKHQHNRKVEEQEKEKGKKNLSRHHSSSDKSTSSQRSGSSHRSSSSQRPTSSQTPSPQKRASSHHSASTQRSDLKKSTKSSTIRKGGEQKKLLNYKGLLDETLRSTTFNGTNGSGLAILQKHGSFTSDNVTLTETAINNTILRIHLCRDDLSDLKRQYRLRQTQHSNRRKRKVQQVSSFGRQIKKKRYFYDYVATTSPPIRKIPNVQQKPQQSPRINLEVNQYRNNSLLSADKAVDIQMKNKEEIKENKRTPTVVGHSYENNKTLNRAIRKNDRDKFRVKFFPKTSTPVRNAINRSNITPGSALQLHREILFVKQYKNDHLSPKQEQKYYLRFPFHRYHEDGVLNYAFQKLVTDVKHMKLPAPSWKIKVIIRQGKISAITFTNKLQLERCVNFSINTDRYRITIDNRPALLLGSPNSVNNASELEILLDIIQNIESDNPMIFYK